MLLEVRDLVAGYGNKQVLHNIDLNIKPGEIVALFGHNGAGKSTTLNAIFGLLLVKKGNILFKGEEISNHTTFANVKSGITLVPQGTGLFSELTVLENLKLGTYALEHRERLDERLREVYNLFPILEDRKSQMAGTLSGGERQMLAIGISLMMRPELLLLDEPSLGLAPVLVQSLMESIKEINQRLGTGILLVEQNIPQALIAANRVYVMKMGEIVLEESSERFLQRDSYWELF